MKLNLLVIRAKEPEGTMQFYKQLGLDFEYHQHANGPFHYSSYIGETVFEIYPLLKNQASADRSLRLGFEVKELNRLIIDLIKAGTKVVQDAEDSEWGYRAIVQDPDGRKVELCDRRKE